MMTFEELTEHCRSTDFLGEWEKYRQLMGTVFINFKTPEVVRTFDKKAGNCRGIYVLYDACTEKLFNLYCGVSEKESSTCRNRVMAHCRSVENVLGLGSSSSESSGKKIVDYFEGRDYATLAAWYMDLEQFDIKGFNLLVEENLIPILKGPFNRENKEAK